MSTTFPIHYLDGENKGECRFSGSPRTDDSQSCPNGCSGARYHYANDGHPECEDEEEKAENE